MSILYFKYPNYYWNTFEAISSDSGRTQSLCKTETASAQTLQALRNTAKCKLCSAFNPVSHCHSSCPTCDGH